MSATDTPSSTPAAASPKPSNKNNDGKSSEDKKKKRAKRKSRRNPRKPTLKTKVVVRRLPPNLPEEIFRNSVKPWVNEENVDYSSYVAGKLSKSKAKESIFSRAYFHFKTMDDVLVFHQGFDGHRFVDSRGNEFKAVVEFAPYQRIPKEHKTVDSRQGTIEEDKDYLDFLESLKAEENAQTESQNEPADGLTQIERLENKIAMVTANALAAEQANKPKTTPLLEHLRAQKAAQAAAKAKAAAKKNARRKAEKSTQKKAEQAKTVQQPQQQQSSAAGEGKKKRERNRKKKDPEAIAKKAESGRNGDASSVSSATGSTVSNASRSRPPKEGSKSGNKEPRPARPNKDQKTPRPPKEGSNNSKPKRPNNKKSSNTGEAGGSNEKSGKQPQVIKILGRQSPAPPRSTLG